MIAGRGYRARSADMVGNLGRQSGVVTAPERVICVTLADLPTLTHVAVRAYGSSLPLLGSGWRL
jgi:hypothetical protein